MTIRIEKVYGKANCDSRKDVFVNLKKLANGMVEYKEDVYLRHSNIHDEREPKIITADEANKIYTTLKQWATPYVQKNENEPFTQMMIK